ncbi:MAG: hypothetical protein Q4G04_06585 [bacterium]|nr:hypothetical protein [bacterium]
MKKVLIGIFAVLMCFTLVGCGKKNEDVKVENKVNLSIDKSAYTKEERIEVSIDFGKTDKDNAVIVITESSTKHESEKYVHDEKNYTEYRYLADFSEIPFYMWAPNKDGKYDVRVYENNDGGKELASVSFEVNAKGSSDTTKKDDTKDDDDDENKTAECKKINQEHMAHFGIAGFDVESSYCVYIYDYRDYVDSIKIYFVADKSKQLEVADSIFTKSGSHNRTTDVEDITSVSEAKNWYGNAYHFYTSNYVYSIDFIEEEKEESVLNDRVIKANSVLIEIMPYDMWYGNE